jgi:serine/tyrosine/threonine adenylyltransferase
VIDAQARLVAQWMMVGFIHGVMNTDNMAVSGETIDFGPCAFLDNYDPATVFSSIDNRGRYAYANQPHAAAWNLTRLAEALLPCIDPVQERAVELATASLGAFAGSHEKYWLDGMRAKTGLQEERAGDLALVHDLLALMHAQKADFTLAFRALCEAAADDSPGADQGGQQLRALFPEPAGLDAWALAWRARLAAEPLSGATRAEKMRRVNPLYIPRNHQVEKVIRAGVDRDDFAPFRQLLQVLSQPFAAQPGREAYTLPPQSAERVLQTFCGT